MPGVPPAEAAALFGDRLSLAVRFADWLVGPGIVRGLLGPREAEQVWGRHVLNGVGISAHIAAGSAVMDLGSGAGLPGIPILLARPDLRVILIEPKARRCAFLVEVCEDLGLPAEVVRARATPEGLVRLPEETALQSALVDVVIARAVAPIAELGRWAAPLLRPGGTLFAVKGATAVAELERDRSVLSGLGFVDLHVLRVEVDQPAPSKEPAATPRLPGIGAATVVTATLRRVSRETAAQQGDPGDVSRETGGEHE